MPPCWFIVSSETEVHILHLCGTKCPLHTNVHGSEEFIFILEKKFNPKRTSFLNIFLKFIGLIYQFLTQKRIISGLVWRLVRGRLDQDFSVTCSYIGKYRKKRAITENSTTLLLARSCFSNSRLFCSQIAFVV